MPPQLHRQFTWALRLLLLLAAGSSWAQSPVWEIEKNGRSMFIGGTMHLLTPEDYPLPKAFEKAYRKSSRIIFETDLERLQNPDFQLYMLQQLSYDDGRNLRQVLHADTYRALADFFEERGMAMTGVDNFRPGMVAMLMTVVELQRIGVVAAGVDDHFNNRLRQDQKARGQLETAEQQIAFLADLGAGNEDAMLSYSLKDLEGLPERWRAMTRAWRSGDMAALDRLAAAPLRDNFPQIHRALLLDRNDAWMPQIESLAQSKPVELLLVGALHLVGEDGLLAELAGRGYSVRQLP